MANDWNTMLSIANGWAEKVKNQRPFVMKDRDHGYWLITWRTVDETRAFNYRRAIRIGYKTINGHLAVCEALIGFKCDCGKAANDEYRNARS